MLSRVLDELSWMRWIWLLSKTVHELAELSDEPGDRCMVRFGRLGHGLGRAVENVVDDSVHALRSRPSCESRRPEWLLATWT